MTTALSSLPDSTLLSRLDTLAARERRITRRILDHLLEVERRELHFREGYESLFAYCTTRLGYSASAANRRIRTMRAMRRFPRVREMLETGRVNLSTVSMVASQLREDNHAELLSRIAGRSQREVERIVADLAPAWRVRDSVTAVRVAATPPVAEASTNRTLGCNCSRSGRTAEAPAAAGTTVESAESGAREAAEAARSVRDGTTAGSDSTQNTQFVVRFAAGPDVVKKIEAARALLSFRLPGSASLAQVLGAVLDEFIDRHDPKQKNARRKARAEKRAAKNAGGDPESPEGRAADHAVPAGRATVDTTPPPDPRAVPAAVRDAVMGASDGRCEYVGSSGRRCGARTHLQVDHIVPVARGGTAAAGNLRVLCARHNRLEAKRLLGTAAATAWRAARE